jgi:DNA modification methylase
LSGPAQGAVYANHGGPGDAIYDPFLGSGTTLIACEMLGRTCFGMEFDPIYCDVIVKRWEDFTGKAAERRAMAEDRP